MNEDELREEFIRRTNERHVNGEEEFGDSWKRDEKDWVEEAIEELLDAGNYLSYLYAKLKKLQNEIHAKR